MGEPELQLRRAAPGDRDEIIELCRASLGWKAGDPNEGFFAWKHDENPFGASPSWVAVSPAGDLVGLRVFLRWRFVDTARRAIQAVRAVDTATHPAWQGKGIFTRLTTGALPDLLDDDIDVVFNTPNEKSRPGYLKMGWQVVGRVPVAMRPGSVTSLARLGGARRPADMWSAPCGIGFDARDLFEDVDAVTSCSARVGRGTSAITTDRSPEYLSWRYRFGPLRYRVALVGDSIEDGLVVFRLRRRGSALECTVCEVLVPPGRHVGKVFGAIRRATRADYLLQAGSARGRGASLVDGMVPVHGVGPILTWRPLNRVGVPTMTDLDLSMGDVELF